MAFSRRHGALSDLCGVCGGVDVDIGGYEDAIADADDVVVDEGAVHVDDYIGAYVDVSPIFAVEVDVDVDFVAYGAKELC